MAAADNHTTFYHHTDPESAKLILESKKILQSDQSKGDAVKGSGTYVTKFGPEKTREEIAKNNYDGVNQFWEDKIKNKKTDVVFEMKLPTEKVQDHSKDLNRDVHLYPGDVHLTDDAIDVKVHVRQGNLVKTYEPTFN